MENTEKTYLKCLDTKRGTIFFVCSELSEVNYLLLIDHLLDLRIKIKHTNTKLMSQQNPFLQKHHNVLYINNASFGEMDVALFIEQSLEMEFV